MPFHRQPHSSKADIAEDIRNYIHEHSDDAVKLETLERLSSHDLNVIALAFGDMERKIKKLSASTNFIEAASHASGHRID